jgi:hypothetical protein
VAHADGSITIDLPVVIVEAPHPYKFDATYHWLYDNSSAKLLATLLPLSVDAMKWVQSETAGVLRERLAQRAPEPTLNQESRSSVEDAGLVSPDSLSSSLPPSPETLIKAEIEAEWAVRQAIENERATENSISYQREYLMKKHLAQAIARAYPFVKLMERASYIHAMWTNGTTLGIHGKPTRADPSNPKGMWETMDYAWEVILAAMLIRGEIEKDHVTLGPPRAQV